MTTTPAPRTFTYRSTSSVDGSPIVQLKVDVYAPIPSLQAGETPRIAVYWHSGGLTAGSRHLNAWFPRWILAQGLSEGFTFLIPDYTLLGPGTAADMLDDAQALAVWIRTDMEAALGLLQGSVTGDFVVIGQSAGGYLAYLMATQVSPPPKAIAVFYGMGGNFLDDHHVKSKTAPFQHWMPFHASGDKFKELDLATRSDGVKVFGDTDDDARVGYFSWLLQNGTFLDKLLARPGLSHELAQIDEALRPAKLDPELRPYIPSLNITKSFPPAYLVHGASDTAVHVEETRNVVRRLRALGALHVYLETSHEHGFDWADLAPRPGLAHIIPFLKRHMEDPAR